jgi:hypothetical protein
MLRREEGALSRTLSRETRETPDGGHGTPDRGTAWAVAPSDTRRGQ